MSHLSLAALLIDINRPAQAGSTYSIELKRRPASADVNRLNTGYAVDASSVLQVAEKVLQANFMKGVPIEFRSKSYETIADALEAIRSRSKEWE